MNRTPEQRREWANGLLDEWLRDRNLLDSFYLAVDRLQEAIYDLETCDVDDHACCLETDEYKRAIKVLDTEISYTVDAFEDALKVKS